MNKIEILFEDNHLIVAVKPPNVPVQADVSGKPDFLSMLKEYVKEKYNKPGAAFVGMVHRLDRPVGGVMVFAKTSKAASRLSEQIRTRKMIKKYIAVSDKKPETISGERVTLIDYLEKDRRINKVKVYSEPLGNAKESELTYLAAERQGGFTLLDIELKTGRPHQIRAQMAKAGLPLYGDNKYGAGKPRQSPALWALQLEFYHPVSKELLRFKKLPPEGVIPWCVFNTLSEFGE